MLRYQTLRNILIKNKNKSLANAFRDSFERALSRTRLVETAQEKAQLYKGEFHEYARPYDRYLEESRFKEEKRKLEE